MSSTSVAGSAKIVSRHALTVPAGNFTDVLKVEVTYSNVEGSGKVTWWLARNVGSIKEVEEKVGKADETLVLRSAAINGQNYGSQAVRTD